MVTQSMPVLFQRDLQQRLHMSDGQNSQVSAGGSWPIRWCSSMRSGPWTDGDTNSRCAILGLHLRHRKAGFPEGACGNLVLHTPVKVSMYQNKRYALPSCSCSSRCVDALRLLPRCSVSTSPPPRPCCPWPWLILDGSVANGSSETKLSQQTQGHNQNQNREREREI